MKKAFLYTLLLTALINTATFAQQERMGRKTAEQRTELIVKNLSEKLILTPEQNELAREVVLKREKLRDAGTLSKEKQKEIHGDLNKILTKEQQDKWVQLRKEARAKHSQKDKKNKDSVPEDDTY